MSDERVALPRWGGVTEPATVATNLVLATAAFVFAARLAPRADDGSLAVAWLAAAMAATSGAALVGAMAHGLDPTSTASLRGCCWRAALYATGCIGAGCIASVAFFAASGAARVALLALAVVRLVAYVLRVARRPEFRVAAADYGGALAVVLAGAVYMAVRHRTAGTTWLIAGALVSLVAGIVQARRLAPHRLFNHNDLYHVIQTVALYAFYRGGTVLADQP